VQLRTVRYLLFLEDSTASGTTVDSEARHFDPSVFNIRVLSALGKGIDLDLESITHLVIDATRF
jgi:hypothetical protein